MSICEVAPLLSCVDDPAILIDDEHRVIDVNEAARRRFGGNAAGSPIGSLLGISDGGRDGALPAALGEASRRRGAAVRVELFSSALGVGMELRIVALRDGFALFLRERAGGDAHRRVPLDMLPQLVWTCRPDGTCDYLSRQWVEYTGVPEAEQQGFRWLEQIHPDERERTSEAWAAAVAGKSDYDLEYRLRGADGAYCWFKARGVPVRDGAGRIVQWFGTSTDISELIEAGQTLARSRSELAALVGERTHELQEANERLVREMQDRLSAEEALRQSQKMAAVGQLIGGVAHDFNNLLTVVTGNLDLLGHRLAHDPRLLKLVTTAAGAAARGAKLTNQLLAFSRKQQLMPQVLDVNAVLAEMVDLLRRSVSEGIELRVDADSALWPVFADRNQIELMILNLVLNSRDALDGSGSITIKTENVVLDDAYAAAHREAVPGPHLRLTVADDGCGMPADVLARVFEPFFTTKPVGKGTGLGLSTIYGFVRQSGGHITIDSRPGEGTVVQIFLPRSPVLYASDDDGLDAPDIDAAGDGETILVVEDDPGVRAVAVSVLKELGYTVVEADNGEAALRIIADCEAIDLLFTDVIMPGTVNGVDLAKAAVERRPGIKVIFTSGYTTRRIAEEWSNGHARILRKPYRPVDLAEQVRLTLEGGGPFADDGGGRAETLSAY